MQENDDKDSNKNESISHNLPPKNFQRKTMWKRVRPQVPSALFAQPIFAETPDGLKKAPKTSVNKPSYLKRNQNLSYIIALTHFVGFLTPIWVIFGTDHLGLSLSAALILGSTSWVASAFFEIPMGAFADRYGRKLSLTLGLLFCAIGDLALVLLDNFFVLMAFQVLSGVGFAMRSGSLEGLLHDTYEAAKDKTGYSKLSSQMLFLLNISRVVTVPIGAWLYNLNTEASLSSYTYPYIASVISYFIAFSAASLLTEKRSEQQLPENTSTNFFYNLLVGQVGETIYEMRKNLDVVRIVFILGAYALIGEGNWALYQQYFRDRGIEVGLSGWIFTALVICMALGSLFVPQIYRRVNVMWALIFITALVSFNIFLMTLDNLWLPIVAMAFIANSFVSPMALYLHDNAIQNRMSGNHKVTALSLASVTYTIGAAIGVWGVGAIAGAVGLYSAQLTFVFFGFVVVVITGLWCSGEPLDVLPEDHEATHETEVDAESVLPVKKSKPKSIPPHPNEIDRDN